MTYAQKWLPIPGFPGYEVSDQGNVRNVKHDRILVQHAAANGSGLYVNLGRSTRLVHKLVMLAFEGNGSRRISHLNGDRRDNRLSNLTQRRRDSAPAGSRCSNGHELSGGNVALWGGSNRICVACRDGRPANRELPDILK